MKNVTGLSSARENKRSLPPCLSVCTGANTASVGSICVRSSGNFMTKS